MQNIIIRHLSGSKAGQVEQFTTGDFNELTLGRDPASTIPYDTQKDAQVGRQHARIIRDSYDPKTFCITDLSSRNGTYVNNQEIQGTVRIKSGDVIRFGPSG